MLARLLSVVLVVFAFAGPALSIEVRARLQKIDLENRQAVIIGNRQERVVKIADDVQVVDEQGKDLSGGLSAKELQPGAIVTLRVERVADEMLIKSIRLGVSPTQQRQNAAGTASVGKSTVGLTPLNEMAAEDRYQGEGGGLYGGGDNELPETLRAAAANETALIVPRDAQGTPASAGQIGLVSISMSNATQEFSKFKQLADADPQKSRSLTIVDCAQGGQTMARWADPQAACWAEANRRLQVAGLSPQQVQVAWIKLANAGPSGQLREHGQQLDRDSRSVLANLTKRFPNLRIAYLGSRIYGGYAEGRLNPEPYAYEGAFVVRWLIQSQLKADPDLNYDAAQGPVKSPLLLWGPYFWSDGMTPRKSDGQVWQRSDFVADGTHPSDSGRKKVAAQLLTFFQTDPLAQSWFLKK